MRFKKKSNISLLTKNLEQAIEEKKFTNEKNQKIHEPIKNEPIEKKKRGPKKDSLIDTTKLLTG